MDTKQIVKKLMERHQTNNPFIIADNLEIIILNHPMKNTLGFFSKYKRSKFIHLSNNLPDKLQTFVCAHELGHAILHPNVNTPFLKRHTLFSTSKIEHQANTFAVELLMPDDLLQECSEISLFNIAESLGIPSKLADLKEIKK